ncbi:hypothetical protein [Solwaraspora sp. WMMA2101]|uniref:hypothetical protein n=1 Tax=Solwaraspora sp. WMMA2101 TaxID=3404124 RepID=UPI003B93CDF0
MGAVTGLVLLFGLVACALAVVAAALVMGRARRPAEAVAEIPRAVARRTAMLRWIGVTIGMLVGIIAAGSGDLGVGLLLAAPLFGLCALIGVLAGELTVRPPHGPTRTAALEVRRIRDYLPRHLSRVVAVAGSVLLILVAGTTAAGGPDDMGRSGRWLTRQCTLEMSESRGPWPGSYYTGGLMLVVLIGLLMAYLAVRTIVRRPRYGGADEVAVDDAQRRRAAYVVTGAVGVLVAIPLAGVSLTAANGLLGISCAPMWWTITGWFLLALASTALAMVGWSAAAIFLPTDRAEPLVRTR